MPKKSIGQAPQNLRDFGSEVAQVIPQVTVSMASMAATKEAPMVVGIPLGRLDLSKSLFLHVSTDVWPWKLVIYHVVSMIGHISCRINIINASGAFN